MALKIWMCVGAVAVACAPWAGCRRPEARETAGGSAAVENQFAAEVRLALANLKATTPSVAALARDAKAVLVFPDVVKAGLVVGGQGGRGVMFRGDQIVGYYRTGGVSWGLQAGAQKYGYAMFLMTDDALRQLDTTSGWEIGVGPSVVVMDEGMARNFTTTTLQNDVYAFVFGQQGLMAGLGLQGTRITRE